MALGRKTDGLKQGTPNRQTVKKQGVAVQRQERALASVATPIEVMIADMRFHHAAALAELLGGLLHAEFCVSGDTKSPSEAAGCPVPPRCWPSWQASRKAEAVAALENLGITTSRTNQ